MTLIVLAAYAVYFVAICLGISAWLAVAGLLLQGLGLVLAVYVAIYEMAVSDTKFKDKFITISILGPINIGGSCLLGMYIYLFILVTQKIILWISS